MQLAIDKASSGAIAGKRISTRVSAHAPMGVIGVLLADDQHRPVLVNGKPVTAPVNVTTALVL